MRRTSTAILVAVLGILMASTAAAATPAQGAVADEAAVRATIARGYDGCRTYGGSNFEFSPDFQRAWDRAVGKDGAMNGDPFCIGGEDPEAFHYRIVSLSVDGARAVANVDVDIGLQFLDPGESPWFHERLTFVRTPQGWRIDDLGDETEPSMKAAMMRDKPGSWGL